jgi:hypothetical protein
MPVKSCVHIFAAHIAALRRFEQHERLPSALNAVADLLEASAHVPQNPPAASQSGLRLLKSAVSTLTVDGAQRLQGLLLGLALPGVEPSADDLLSLLLRAEWDSVDEAGMCRVMESVKRMPIMSLLNAAKRLDVQIVDSGDRALSGSMMDMFHRAMEVSDSSESFCPCCGALLEW